MKAGFDMRLRSARCWAALGLVASLGLGCRKETPPPEKKDEKAAAVPVATEPRKSARAVDEGVEVPTEEDFEEAAEKQITAETDLQKELDLIEKQIQKP